MKKLPLLLLSASTLLSTQALAEAPAPNYTSVSAYYHNFRVSGDSDVQYKGPGVALEHQLAGDVFLYGNYRDGKDTDGPETLKFKNWQAGVGTFYALNRTSTVDVLLLAGADKRNTVSEEFFAGQLGYRKRITHFVEMGLFYRHYNYETLGADNSFGGFLRYHTDQQVTFDLRYQTHDFGNLIQAGISYKF